VQGTPLFTRFVLLLGVVSMILPSSVNRADEPPAKRIVVIAHRGEHHDHPENTLPAIAAAVALGCDYVELDVRETRDGALVLMHDGDVDRTTDGRGDVADLSLAEVKALEVTAPRDKFPEPVRVPTLGEALDVYADKIQLYLDHKQANEALVVDVLRQHDMIARTAVYGSPDDLAKIRSHDANIRLMPSHPEGEAEMRRLHDRLSVGVFDGGVRDWTAAEVTLAHSLGAEVWVDCLGDQDNPRGWRHAAAIGVDGIQSDRPAELIKLLEELGLH
jgi:glycerophosphoryl diester phosphodiesterase